MNKWKIVPLFALLPVLVSAEAPPASKEMGFVVTTFVQPVIYEKEACPNGPTPKLRPRSAPDC
jgi:hypothetical protein